MAEGVVARECEFFKIDPSAVRFYLCKRHFSTEFDFARLLDVGALKPDNYANFGFLKATPIDLHARHPQIVEQDFMDIKSNSRLYKEWDVISLSLVLNFVPDALQRGHMLQLTYELLRPRGLLFVVVSINYNIRR